MADQVPGIPGVPNMAGQEAAIAGAAAANFTGQEKKVIQERGGEADEVRAFTQVLKEGPLTADIENIENEESNATPQHTPAELKGRRRDHRRMLHHSPIYAPREKVEITNVLPDKYNEEADTGSKPKEPKTNPETELKEETAALAKELKFNPTELFKRLEMEQKQLHYLISRIKELHLQRLVTEKREAFTKITEQIRQESLASVKKEAFPWLEEQLNRLTLGAAEYKLKLLQSLEKLEFDQERHNDMFWLVKVIEYYASK